MNKIVKGSLALLAALCVGNMTASAKTMTATDIENISKIEFGGVTTYENIYIYGKNVHVNMITMSDLILAGADMEGVKDKALYYKNGDNVWTKNDGLAENTVNKSSLPTFEMTRLIGSLSGDHVSEETDLYDGEYIKTEEYTNGRKAEVFVDETAPLSIVDIKPVQVAANLGSQISTDTNKHNMTALDVSLEEKDEKNYLYLTEKYPLLEYHNGTSKGKWFGLLIKTNIPVTRDDIKNDKVDLIVTGTELNYSKFEDSSVHGGSSNEIIVWLKNDDSNTLNNKTIILKDKTGEEVIQQEVTIKYDSPFVAAFTDEVVTDSEPTVTATEGVNTKAVKVDNKYVVLFYTSDEKISKVEYTIDGDKKVATGSAFEWTPREVMQVLGAEAVEPANDKDWNQKAITIVDAPVAHTSTTKEPYDYVVTIHHNLGLKDLSSTGVSVNVDLSVKDGVTCEKDVTSTEVVTNTTKWTVKLTKTESIVTFKHDSDKDIAIKFVLVDETPELAFNAKIDKDLKLYATPANQAEQNSNDNYFKNMDNVSIDTTKEDDNYVVTVQQLNRLKKLETFTYNSSSSHKVGVIVDLGVDLSKLTVDNKAITEKDITLASDYGNTAFIIWLDNNGSGNGTEKTFNYSETNATLKVTFKLLELSENYITDADDSAEVKNDVVIADEYAQYVKYEKGKGFIVPQDLTKFVATTTETVDGEQVTTEYTYVKGTDSKFHKVKNIKLNNVIVGVQDPGKVDNYEKNNYNQASITSAVIDSSNNNVINVILNRPLGATRSSQYKEFALVVDLGVNVANVEGKTNYGIEANDRKDAWAHAGKVKGSEGTENLVVLWIDGDISSTEEGQVMTFVNKETGTNCSSTACESVEYTITVKTTLNETRPNLVLKNTGKVVLDDNKIEDKGINQNAIDNNSAINSEIKEDKVVISYDKDLKTDSSTAEDIGIILDLGISPEKIALKEGTNAKIEKTNNAILGATGTEFVLWLDTDEMEKGLDLTFNQSSNPDNTYAKELTIHFELKDVKDNIKLVEGNVTERAETAVPGRNAYDQAQYTLNQNRLTYTFETTKEAKTIKISPVDKELPVSYNLGSANGSWYAIEINLGRSIKNMNTSNVAKVIWFEEIDYENGHFIMWVNVTGEAIKTGKEVTITDSYNDSEATFKVTYSTVNE